MPKYDTKLKLGRKLRTPDAAKASDNQVSVLFRFDESGADRHVSLSIESDDMTADDVAALLDFLAVRGRFAPESTRTWVSQPQASVEKFGETTRWQGADVGAMARGG